MKSIIDELNADNGTNYKLEVLAKHKDNDIFKEMLHKTYCKVSWTFGVNLKTIDKALIGVTNTEEILTLADALKGIERLHDREVTGNDAISFLNSLFNSLSEPSREILVKVLRRDLKINVGRTGINKVFKNLIVKPPYTRCEIGTEANILKNMPVDKDGNFINKVYSEVKMDGTFRRAVKADDVEITSRPGIETPFPLIEKQLKSIEVDGVVFIGEMTLRGEQNRSVGNGILNSDDIPHEDVLFTVWDMVPIHEYSMTKDEIKKAEKAKTLSLYEDRFEQLITLLKDSPLDNVELIEYRIVKNMAEAFEHFQEVTERGDEGTVIKAFDMTHKDGNSKKQLKVKLVIEIDVRIVKFNEGNKDSKNEEYFSGIEYTNDEGTIQGSVGVTSLTEELRDWFHEHREEVTGDVMTLLCNDITIGRDSKIYALSHPRYDKLRGKDKITDTLERALEQKQMAMEMKVRVR